MNPYPSALQTIDAVHKRVSDWAHEVLTQGGLGHIEVVSAFRSEDAPDSYMVLLPYRLTPWPKLVDTGGNLPLLGVSPGSLGSQVPRPWQKVGQLLTETLTQVFPSIPGRGSQPPRVAQLARIDRLPAPLKAWYEEQGDDGTGDSWVVDANGVPCARLPSLEWRVPVGVRVFYLIQLVQPREQGLDQTGPLAVSSLAMLTLGIHLNRTLRIQLPPFPSAPSLIPMLRAIAQSAPQDERGEQLRDLVEEVSGPAIHRLSLLPRAELPSDDFAMVMRALRRPLQPTLHLAVQLRLGAGPVLTPAVTPAMSTDRKRESS